MLALDIDLELFSEVIADVVPPCESIHHGTGDQLAAFHEGPASWKQVGNCPHTTGFRCDKVVQHILARAHRDPMYGWRCNVCDASAAPGFFIPIADL